MRKALTATGITLALAGMFVGPFTGTIAAQQPAASAPQQAPAAQPSSPASAGQTPAATPAKPATPKAKAPAAKPGTPAAKTPLTLKTQKEKASYAIGMSVGKGLHKDQVDVDPAILARGVRDGLAGGKTLLTEDEAKAAIGVLQVEMRKKQEEKMALAGEANKKTGEAFLTANKSKDGVVALPSGLQYKILKEGTGPKPAATDSVVCNYRGTLINDTEFDSSYKRGQPATFPVTGVIKGWTEALQLMPVGSKWQLFVPAELAYGAQQRGPDITPNSTLIFEVELLSIQPKAEMKPEAKPEATPETKPETKPDSKP